MRCAKPDAAIPRLRILCRYPGIPSNRYAVVSVNLTKWKHPLSRKSLSACNAARNSLQAGTINPDDSAAKHAAGHGGWSTRLQGTIERLLRALVPAVEKPFWTTLRASGSLALIAAISKPDSEVTRVNSEQLDREQRYRMVMAAAKNMLRRGLISAEEYREFDAQMVKKIKPFFGGLSAENR